MKRRLIELASGKKLRVWCHRERPHVVLAGTSLLGQTGWALTFVEAVALRTALDNAIVELAKRLDALPKATREPAEP